MFGHGTFIYNPNQAREKHDSWDGVAAAVADLHMTHAWIRGHGKDGLYFPDENKQLIDALRKKNIAVYAWGWCHGGANSAKDRDNVARCLETFQPDGYVADIEHGVAGANWTVARIKSFLSDIKPTMNGKPLVLSTFGFIPYHEPELMQAANAYVDAFAPQVYWFWYPKRAMFTQPGAKPPYPENNAAAYTNLCIDVWRHVTDKPLVITGQAYWKEAPGWTQQYAEKKLREFIDGFDRYGDIAGLNWWHLAGDAAMSPKMAELIRGADFSSRLAAPPVVAAVPVPADEAPAAAHGDVAPEPPGHDAPPVAAAAVAAAPPAFAAANPALVYIAIPNAGGNAAGGFALPAGVPVLPAQGAPNVAYVKTDALNLRATPRGDILAELTIGDQVQVLGPADMPGWKQVVAKGQTGFVFGGYLREPVHPEVEKLLAQAIGEWVRFKKGQVREEVQPYRGYVGQMWQALGLNYDGASRYADGKEVPWSAAYISYVVRNAGPTYKNFKFAAAHSRFVNDAIQARVQRIAEKPFWGYRISETKPALGDIIQCSRGRYTRSFDYAENHAQYDSHSDIVVEVRDKIVRVVGGNVGETVTLGGPSEYDLDDNGMVKPGQRVIAILKNRAEILSQLAEGGFVGV